MTDLAHAQSSLPNPPSQLTATPSSATQVDLSWNSPDGIVTAYKIMFALDNGNFQDLVTNTDSNATIFHHRNLTPNHVYYYQVFALNSSGQSTGSNIAIANMLPGDKVPDAPTFLAVTQSSQGTLLSWNAPQNNGGSPIMGYKIEYAATPNHWTTLNANTESQQTTYQTGISFATNYDYRVSAINSMGVGSATASNSIQSRTSPVLTITAISPTQVNLSWIPPSYTYAQQIIGYKIEIKAGTTYVSQVENTGLVTSQTIDGLTTGKTYTYHVMALYAGDTQSPPSSDVSITPSSTSFSSFSPAQNNLPYGTSIFLGRSYPGTINTVTFSNSGPQTQYFSPPNLPVNGIWANVSTHIRGAVLYFDSNGRTYSTNVNPDSNKWISFPFPMIISNVRMSILDRVNPNDVASVGYVTSSDSVQTQSIPDAPQNLNAFLNSTDTVQLFWNAPQNANPPIAGYTIEYKTSGDWFILAQNVPLTTFVQSGLALNNTYTFRVYAVNAIGPSLPSNEASISTPASNLNNQGGIISQVLNGIIPIGNTTTSLSYSISGGQVYGASINKDTNTLNFQLQGNTAGALYLQLPRTLIDAKSPEGNDKTFIINVDNKTAVFSETKTDTYRSLTISYPAGKIDVNIIGTSVLGGTNVMAGTIPEFPIALVGLVVGLVPVVFLSRRFTKF